MAEADLNERVEAFNGEVKVLLGKYELAIGAQAGITSDGRIFSQPIILTARKPVVSNTAEEGKLAEA